MTMPGDAPAGFVYRPEFVSESEERDLVDAIGQIEFSDVKMRGAVARRRTAHFSWRERHARSYSRRARRIY